ncbi:MAG: 30S ribosomal protein S2 [Bifidobacteriaceae bacterium]|jgi:small subunit ribosomal protein S2|nr:30S ribosomal protein S2 [Bifidobacteriaceae bacterium]
MAVVTMKGLLDAGVHFGHPTRNWNPKMKPYILTSRNGNYIVDLNKTIENIDIAYDFVKGIVGQGGTILFVGTKRQAKAAISELATKVGMPYVSERWPGGMLTNLKTVMQSVRRLKDLEQIDFENITDSEYTKKELLILEREKFKLEKLLNGVRDMAKKPTVIWVVDVLKERIAVDEARKLGIPIVAILDTNCDPALVDYPIAGNDDATKSIELLTNIIADAVAQGIIERSNQAAKNLPETSALPDSQSLESGDVSALAAEEEPLAEWEKELLEAAQLKVDESIAAVEAKKTSSKKPAPKKAVAEKEVVVKKVVTKKPAPKKPAPKKAVAEKAVAEKEVAKKLPAKKSPVKKASVKKAAPKKPAPKKAVKK